MPPPGTDPAATTLQDWPNQDLHTGCPTAIPTAWESYLVAHWPAQWLANLDTSKTCTVIKSLPLTFVEEAVPDGDEGQQQLLQWAQPQQDLDIHLQV